MEVHQDLDLKLETPPQNIPHLDPQIKFYDEFCKLYLANKILIAQLEELNHQKTNLLAAISKWENDGPHNQNKEHDENNPDMSHEDKKKRIRRVASQIQRHYQCKTCNKSYGSEGSLNQHIKFKHHQAYKEMVKNGPLDVKQEQMKGNYMENSAN